ncbi:MAG TPA: sigma-70 family RNA polymerase sigma factor [Streptosporangiaceae bacterium]|nr:sigma-70 family RNA polymerase sigma factor [Streptosporangiaceae bacterium]
MADAGFDIAELFRRNHLELVRLALLLVGDRPTAEDVVQEVFASLHMRRERLSLSGDPLAYARVAVLNRCRSVLRRRAVARRFAGGRELRLDESNRSAEHEVISSEERRQVMAALAALPRRRREVLVLRYYLDLNEAEIARVLRIKPGTVKSTAARGLAALARSLGEES